MAKLQKAGYEKEMVYLVQFPRAKCAPSLSPYCLKLETWLRMNDIKYENLSNNFRVFSSRGQLPFVELNGKEIADSKLAIECLGKHFDKHMEQGVGEAELAAARAFECMIEESLFWKMVQWRSCNVSERLFGKDAMGDNAMPAVVRYMKPVLVWRFASMFSDKCNKQGTGKYTGEELVELGKRDLKALDTFLSGKQYLAGNQPTTYDATAFGHLCQLYYLPASAQWDLKDYIEAECKNIVAYLQRIRDAYWPDWQRACDDLDLASHLPKKEEADTGAEDKKDGEGEQQKNGDK